MTRIMLVVLLVVGCSKKKDAPKQEPASGTAVASGSAPAPVDAAAPAEPPKKAELLPAKLGEKEGVVFAEKAGENVTATVGGQPVAIPDATKLEVVGEKEGMVGDQEDTTVTVKFEGKDVELKADRVLQEGALSRSPDGKHAVFTVITGCGDLCHSVIWLVSADGRRAKIGGAGPDTTVAWTPTHVAVGNHGLWIATLADHAVKEVEGYTSPAYSPEGVLYVRDSDGSAFKQDGDKWTRVHKAKKKKPADSDEMPIEDPEPVTFEGGKPKF